MHNVNNGFKRTGKILVEKATGNKWNIYSNGKDKGIKMEESMGVTSGQYIIYLEQLKLDMFTIETNK